MIVIDVDGIVAYTKEVLTRSLSPFIPRDEALCDEEQKKRERMRK